MRLYLSRGKSVDIPSSRHSARAKQLIAEARETLNPYGHSMFGRYRKAGFDSYGASMDREDAEKILRELGEC